MEFDSEKISFDELMLEYAIPSMCSLKIYLKEVWRVKIFKLFFRIYPKDQAIKMKG